MKTCTWRGVIILILGQVLKLVPEGVIIHVLGEVLKLVPEEV